MFFQSAIACAAGRCGRAGLGSAALGALLLVGLAGAPLAPARASTAEQPAIGSIQRSTGTVQIISPRGERPARIGEPIAELERIQTGADGQALIRLNDGTLLALRANTQLTPLRYRQAAAPGERDGMVMQLLRGSLRAVTGLIGKRSPDTVQFRTTTATIGIRGTDFDMTVVEGAAAEAGGTVEGLYHRVNDGATVLENAAGDKLPVAAGEVALAPADLARHGAQFGLIKGGVDVLRLFRATAFDVDLPALSRSALPDAPKPAAPEAKPASSAGQAAGDVAQAGASTAAAVAPVAAGAAAVQTAAQVGLVAQAAQAVAGVVSSAVNAVRNSLDRDNEPTPQAGPVTERVSTPVTPAERKAAAAATAQALLSLESRNAAAEAERLGVRNQKIEEYRFAVAKAVHEANAGEVHAGPMPPLLPAIVILHVEIDPAGELVDLHVYRHGADRSFSPKALALMRSVRFPKPEPNLFIGDTIEWTETVLFDRSGKFQMKPLAPPQRRQ